MAPLVRLDRSDGVATITLNRPAAGNAIDPDLARTLLEVAIICDEDPSIRAVVLTGAGRMFCVGGDLAAFTASGDGLSAMLKTVTASLHGAVARLVRMDKPVVTAINGPAAGAGVGLAILSDIALAAPSAHFTLAYTAVGLSPDGGTSWFLPRLVGLRRAQELSLRNTRVPAAEAAAIGLITRVATDAIVEEATAIARQLASGPTIAFAATRRLLLDGAVTPLETHLDAESRSIAALGRSADGREGLSAFVAKRTPLYTGA